MKRSCAYGEDIISYVEAGVVFHEGIGGFAEANTEKGRISLHSTLSAFSTLINLSGNIRRGKSNKPVGNHYRLSVFSLIFSIFSAGILDDFSERRKDDNFP